MRIQTISLPLLSLLAACTAAAAADRPRELRVPHVGREGILDFQAASDDSVHIRAHTGQWYLVRTTNRCTRLWTATGLGFETRSFGHLDRHGAIRAQGQRCPVASIALSEEPPKRGRRRGG